MAAAGAGRLRAGAGSTPPGAATALLADVRRSRTASSCWPTTSTPPLLEGLDLAGVTRRRRDRPDWAAARDAAPLRRTREVGAMDTFMMIFTSGTSGDPKAVQVAHLMVLFSGLNLVERFSVTADDVCYIAMPLFHSNAVVAGWAVALGSGAAMVPAAVLGVPVPLRRTPLRRDVHELRRQAAGLHPGHARAARRRRQPAAGRVRQRGQRPGHRGVRPPLRQRGDGRLRLDRAGDHHHPRPRHAPWLDRAGRRRGGDLRLRDASPSARWRSSTPPERCSTRTRRSASWSTPRVPATSRATTTTPPPTRSGCGTACTGPATWPTATPTAGSTWPAAPPTGCAWTARTSPPPRSSGSSSGSPRSPWSRCTPSRTPRAPSATR